MSLGYKVEIGDSLLRFSLKQMPEKAEKLRDATVDGLLVEMKSIERVFSPRVQHLFHGGGKRER